MISENQMYYFNLNFSFHSVRNIDTELLQVQLLFLSWAGSFIAEIYRSSSHNKTTFPPPLVNRTQEA